VPSRTLPSSALSSKRARSPRAASRPDVAVAIVAWSAVVLMGAATAAVLDASGRRISIEAPPLHARLEPLLDGSLVAAIVVGLLVIVGLPVLAARARWTVLVASSALAAVVVGVALAAMRGWGRLLEPVEARREYLAVLPKVHDLGRFLETFTDDRIVTYPVHVQGHPPGPVVLAVGLRELGLGGSAWFAAVLVGGAALAVAAVLMSVREVAGEEWARRAAPFVVVSPALVWFVTSADALFAGVGALGVMLVVLATGRRGRHADLLAVAGGLVLGLAAFLSYGLVLLGVIPLVVAWRRRRLRVIAIAAAAAGTVVVAVVVGTGFWWLDGLATTRERYTAGIASRRPYLPFLAIDLAAFGLVLGPATAAGLARLRDRRAWLLVGGGLACVGLALLSGMAKGEVERIWLPFAPWVLVAGAALAARGTAGRGAARGWLAVQLGSAILIESLIRTPW
jgi:hypothetical protein